MKTNPRQGRAAFTLIELMAVITIIVILAGLVVGGMAFVSDRQNKEKARVQLALISKALEEYKLDIGVYPPTGNITTATAPKGTKNSDEALYETLFYEGYEYTEKSNSGAAPDKWTKTEDGVKIAKATKIYLPELDPTSSKQGWVDPVKSPSPPPESTAVRDPWGNQYCYRSATTASGESNEATQNPDFDLWSMGKDGKTNSDPTHKDCRDDIKASN
jgi:prepilin-type N-terminal cleavage/methylation domain-containing protein